MKTNRAATYEDSALAHMSPVEILAYLQDLAMGGWKTVEQMSETPQFEDGYRNALGVFSYGIEQLIQPWSDIKDVSGDVLEG